MTSAELTTVAIAHNMKKMTSVMYAEREKDVRNGRRLSPPRDVPPAARKRVPTSAAGGSQTRWRQGQKKSEILLSGKISDSFDSRGGEQPRRGVSAICNEPEQS